MKWDDNLTQLKKILSEHYPLRDDSYPIVREANIPFASVAFKDKAANNWSEIIDVALRQDRVFHIIHAVVQDNLGNKALQNTLFDLINKIDTQKSLIRISYLYMSRDAEQRYDLSRYLKQVLQGLNIIESDYQIIQTETQNEQEIAGFVNTAHICLLFISPDFMSSGCSRGLMMQCVLERYRKGEVRIILVHIHPTVQEDDLLSDLPSLPKNGKPAMTWQDPSLAYEDIAMGIHKTVIELNSARQPHQNPPLNNKPDSYLGAEEHMTNITPNIPSQIINKLYELHSRQNKVNELKSVHNALHDIERLLLGLGIAIQIAMKDKEEKQIYSAQLFFRKRETKIASINFKLIKNSWQLVVPKIAELKIFAAEEMKALEEEHFKIDDNLIKGPLWITELARLQKDFDTSMEEYNEAEVNNLSDSLLETCRGHLYRIDRQLLSAVKDLDVVTDYILRYVS